MKRPTESDPGCDGNPYLRRFLLWQGRMVQDSGILSLGAAGRIIRTRERMRKRYSFAVPTREAVDALVKISPLFEIGAGNGYWAGLVRSAGGDIRAYDRRLATRPYFPVEEGGANDPRIYELNAGRNLFLCWPPYDTPMARRALANFTGSRVAYAGEGEGGCTGDGRFHEMLDSGFSLELTVRIPQWDTIHDCLRIYRRGSPCSSWQK